MPERMAQSPGGAAVPRFASGGFAATRLRAVLHCRRRARTSRQHQTTPAGARSTMAAADTKFISLAQWPDGPACNSWSVAPQAMHAPPMRGPVPVRRRRAEVSRLTSDRRRRRAKRGDTRQGVRIASGGTWARCSARSVASCQPSPKRLLGRPVHRPVRGLPRRRRHSALDLSAVRTYTSIERPAGRLTSIARDALHRQAVSSHTVTRSLLARSWKARLPPSKMAHTASRIAGSSRPPEM